jgi:hypothetical protein
MKASIIKKFLIAATILIFGATAPALADHIDLSNWLVDSAVGSQIGETPNWALADASPYIYLGVWNPPPPNPGGQDSLDNVLSILHWIADEFSGEAFVSLFPSADDLFLIGKHDTDGSSFAGFMLGDTPDNTFGIWSYTGLEGVVILMAIKAGDHFALYMLKDPFVPNFEYGWSTEDLSVGAGEQPELSHMSLFGTESTPVPEPASLLLLGIGLLAGVLLLPRFQS